MDYGKILLLSLIILLGRPNRKMICRHTNFMTFLLEIIVIASASTHLVKYFTGTIKKFNLPGATGNGPTVSIHIERMDID